MSNIPQSKVHGANMGPIWGRQDPGGPHVGPTNFAIWEYANDDMGAHSASLSVCEGKPRATDVFPHKGITKMRNFYVSLLLDRTRCRIYSRVAADLRRHGIQQYPCQFNIFGDKEYRDIHKLFKMIQGLTCAKEMLSSFLYTAVDVSFSFAGAYIRIKYRGSGCLSHTLHYYDVIMGAMASQITSLTIIYSTVYSRRRTKKTSKLRVTGLCVGNSPVTGEFRRTKGQWRGKCFHLMMSSWIDNDRIPSQMASNVELVSMSWSNYAVSTTLVDSILFVIERYKVTCPHSENKC